MAKDEEFFARQEQMDQQVYESTRSIYETLLLRAIEAAKAGSHPTDDIKVLLETFNNTSVSCQRLMARVRRVEAAATVAADALTPPNNPEERLALESLNAVLRPKAGALPAQG